MTRGRCFILLALASSFTSNAQSKDFEASSVKIAPHLSIDEIKANPSRVGTTISAGLVHMPYASMDDILRRAFDLPENQLATPEWTKTKYYTIEAKIPEGASPSDVPEMFRDLLASRFGMAYHRETRPTQVWALTAPKLKAKPVEKGAACAAPRRKRP